MKYKLLATSIFLGCLCLFSISFSSAEARHHHCGRSSFSINIGAAARPCPETYVVRHYQPCNRVLVHSYPMDQVVVYPAPYYEEVVVYPSRPVVQTGFSFGWFWR